MGLHPSSNERVANRRRLLWRSGSSRRGNQGDQREVMKFTEKVRKEIVARANGRCESCGSIAMYNQIHHRRPRGMGGSRDPLSGSAANGLFVHPACHSKIESDRKQALENGQLVRQGMDPSTVPVKIGISWYLLDHLGGKTRLSGPQTLQS